MLDRDFIHREIRRLAAAMARILNLRNAGRVEEAQHALADARAELLGPLDALLDRVDAATAAQLLGEPAAVLSYATLCWEHAELGGPASFRARAVQLAEAALARDAQLPGAASTLTQWRTMLGAEIPLPRA